MPEHDLPPDSGFDLRVRAELAVAVDPGEPPRSLFREPLPPWSRKGFQRAAAALALAGSAAGAVMAMRPPALVRGAIAHEAGERTLRGSFMDPRELLAQMGLRDGASVPGFPQLMRPCDIDGRHAYHLTTFFEGGGMVTIIAFAAPAGLPEGSGWWRNVYWQVVRTKDGKPLVLVTQQKSALPAAISALRAAASPG